MQLTQASVAQQTERHLLNLHFVKTSPAYMAHFLTLGLDLRMPGRITSSGTAWAAGATWTARSTWSTLAAC